MFQSYYVPLVLLLLVVFSSATNTSNSAPHVGIIGGGPAGLTAAFLLQQQGYEVTVIEKASKVGGLVNTRFVHNKAYDVATVLVVEGSIAGPGIEPTLQEMIDVAGTELQSIPPVQMLKSSPLGVTPIYEIIQDVEPQEIISQVLVGLSYATELALCIEQNIDCVTCGICNSDAETLLDWGNRVGVPAFTNATLFVFDILGLNPAVDIAVIEDIVASFPVVFLIELLQGLGVTGDDVGGLVPPNIQDLLDVPSLSSIFTRGYQTFFDELVKKANINVKLSSAVTQISNKNSQWVVSVNDGYLNYQFDQLIVTSSPQDSLSFLPDSPQKTLLATAAPDPYYKVEFLLKLSGYNAGELVDYGDITLRNSGAGTPDVFSPVGGPVKCAFMGKNYVNTDIFTLGCVVVDLSLSSREVYESAKKLVEGQLGVTVTSLIYKSDKIFWPTYPDDPLLWEEGWETLQGTDGLFFLGEAFSGAGVPTITEYEAEVIPLWFPEISKE